MFLVRPLLITYYLIMGCVGEARTYFTFVNQRKLCTKHPHLPSLGMAAFIVGLTGIAVWFAFYFFDQWYLDIYKTDVFGKSLFVAWVTVIGKSTWILYLTGGVMLAMSIYRFAGFSRKQKMFWHHVFLHFYFVFTTIAFSGLIVVAIKHFIGRARPAIAQDYGTWLTEPFSGSYLYASFPSGHSATMGALAVALFLLNVRWGLLALPICLWVVGTRMHVGAHFPSDVVAGVAIGAIFTYYYARLFARKRLLFKFSENGGLCIRDEFAKMVRHKKPQNGIHLPFFGIASLLKSQEN